MEPIAVSFLLEKAWALAMKWKGSVDEISECYLLLRQPVWRFGVEWEQYRHHSFDPKSAKSILEKNRRQILDIISPLHTKLDIDVYKRILALTDTMYRGISGLDVMGDSPTLNAGDEANQKAIKIIELIDEKVKRPLKGK